MRRQIQLLSFYRSSSLYVTMTLCLLLAACGQPNTPEANPKLNQTYPAQQGGTMIDAMSGEPSNLIAMIFYYPKFIF